ncbi:DUF5682 family protein [Streptomyces luteireticuli]|uniref:DUF5682 family protein n=1 Tax=Streptomyces luteireticuli TaxID=173858 RepID=UPI003557C096
MNAPDGPATSGPALLGVRHHGPGSARAVRAALERRRPRAVLVEGPPEADAIVHLAADPDMRPPVALLAHAADDPGRSAFWPLADFSPEWVAIRWALDRGAAVRFIDLPAAHTLAPWPGRPEPPHPDPVEALAAAAGRDDPERWWEDAVEHRGGMPGRDPLASFRAIAEAMAALRPADGGPDGGGPDAPTGHDAVREAHMRLRLREARREFGDDIAVVCGAWHVPALAARRTAAADRRVLRGLPKVRTEIAWVPWTHRRLARRSGYGAGVTSPGWYGHLFRTPDRPVERWMTTVARLLRAEGHPVSSAHVIEAVRLADTLAAVRGRPLPGLAETTDAILAVMCDGSPVPLALVQDRLVVGDALGTVPDAAPAAPLRRDLTRLQRTLRLPPEAALREREFDLRKDIGAARSRLLHRLRILGVDWGEPLPARGGSGTFKEVWRLCWEPGLAVRLAEAGVWGTTVGAAAAARAGAAARSAGSPAEVTALAEQCLLAGLPDALPAVLRALADRAALEADVGRLARALPALVRAVRYGDVRRTDTGALAGVAAALAERVFAGLPDACSGLGRDAAREALGDVDAVHRAVALLERPGVRERWAAVLAGLAGRERIPGEIRGRAARLLLDEGRLPDARAARLMALALSPAEEPAEAAAWIEGFTTGDGAGGLLLVHDERLFALTDAWLTGVPAGTFPGVLPLLRRTFAEFAPAVRRAVGERVRAGGPGPSSAPGRTPPLDPVRAAAVLPTLRLLLDLGDDLDDNPGDNHDEAPTAPPVPGPGVPGDAPTDAARRERLRRWRLVLGAGCGPDGCDPDGRGTDGTGTELDGDDAAMDRALEALYGAPRAGRGTGRDGRRGGGLGASAPRVARWLGDIRTYFPSSVVQVMQRDALERLGLTQLLLEPELLTAVEADVHLAGTLLSLARAMPEETRATAREVVRKVVRDLEDRLAGRTRAALTGALDRSARARRPRPRDIDWNLTIRANLQHYLPEHRAVVPERLVGHARAARSLRKEVFLCVDQSGSMAASVVHAAVFGAVLASTRSLDTRLIAFDTAVVDLTDRLADPVEALFGVQLGGGTDIDRALAHCQSRITRPAETVVVLISDLHEGGTPGGMLRRVAAMKAAGVRFVALLALSDDGTPAHDHEHAAALAALGVPAFACTPDLFPEVMAAALENRPLPVPGPSIAGPRASFRAGPEQGPDDGPDDGGTEEPRTRWA